VQVIQTQATDCTFTGLSLPSCLSYQEAHFSIYFFSDLVLQGNGTLEEELYGSSSCSCTEEVLLEDCYLVSLLV